MGVNNKLIDVLHLKRTNNQQAKRELTKEEQDIQTKKWATFYRRNIDIYAEYGLSIDLKPFQRVMLHLMGCSQQFFAICSRALGKTFIVGLFCVCKCLLFPYTEVVITASTLDQGGIMVREKIMDELIGKLSPVLKYYYEIGYIKVKIGKEDVSVRFFNGSTIKVLPPLDSSRGPKATVLVYDECRILKKDDVDSIFEGMKHPRQARFLNKKEEYQTDPRLQEECISIYITSARTKPEWFWRAFKSTVVNSYKSSMVEYNFFAGDIFTAIKYGLKTKKDLILMKTQMDEMNVRMELYNEMLGEAKGALFSFDDFTRSQNIQKPFYPPTTDQFNMNDIPNFRVKAHNETRIIVVDFAFADTQTKGQENDNTVFLCMSGTYKNGEIIRNVDYIETLAGGDIITKIRLRELFWDYDADYIVYDVRNGGEVYHNDLTEELNHATRDSRRWDSRGLMLAHEKDLHVSTDKKLEELRKRTIDRKGVPALIPVVGTRELNSVIWQQLKMTMNKSKIKFLLDEVEIKTKLNATRSFRNKTKEERTRLLLPYVQTGLLIIEGIELQAEWSGDFLKVKELRSGTKDRMICLAYGNYFFNLLENKKAKTDSEDDFDEDDWKNIILV